MLRNAPNFVHAQEHLGGDDGMTSSLPGRALGTVPGIQARTEGFKEGRAYPNQAGSAGLCSPMHGRQGEGCRSGERSDSPQKEEQGASW